MHSSVNYLLENECSHSYEYEDGRLMGYCTSITLMIETVSSSETSVNIYKTKRCNIPEDSHLQLSNCLEYFCLKNSPQI
jgi:hypothetical protein